MIFARIRPGTVLQALVDVLRVECRSERTFRLWRSGWDAREVLRGRRLVCVCLDWGVRYRRRVISVRWKGRCMVICLVGSSRVLVMMMILDRRQTVPKERLTVVRQCWGGVRSRRLGQSTWDIGRLNGEQGRRAAVTALQRA